MATLDLCGSDAEPPARPEGVGVEGKVPAEVVRSLWQEELAATLLPANSASAKSCCKLLGNPLFPTLNDIL